VSRPPSFYKTWRSFPFFAWRYNRFCLLNIGGNMQSFDYIAPKSAEEVIALLANKNGNARILCGGTDLLVQLREGRRKAMLVIDVKNIPHLTQISFDPQNGLCIGEATSCRDICSDPNVTKYYPGLVDGI